MHAMFSDLHSRLGDRFTQNPSVLAAHAGGEGLRDLRPPDAVAFPETTEETQLIVRRCHDHGVPVVPYGAGTSLEGQLQAVRGGLCLDMSRMNRILAVSAADLDCRVEAGVTREALNADLRSHGLLFTVDPGADATLGGMASTRASGTNTVRYGAMRERVLGLTVVTPDGGVIQTGGRARKAATGYDLTALYIGAEGTLGVVTELQLRLIGVPEAILAAVCAFETLKGAVDTVTLAIQSGLPLARIELLDALQMGACIRYSRLEGFEAKPTLFFEFHGSPASVEDAGAVLSEIAGSFGGAGFRRAARPEDRRRLWKARHDAYWAARALEPGKDAFATDACVPLSRLAECILETRAEADASGLTCPIVGHVGDGNFHVQILHDPNDPGERATADRLATAIAERAMRMGGACSGEHGIGVHKRAFMATQHGAALSVMQAIKSALDPKGVMNPGKLLPDAPGRLLTPP